MSGMKKMYIALLNRKWRAKNRHNTTSLHSICNPDRVRVGKYTYGALNIEHYNREACLSIGNYCSVAKNVVFLLGGEHDYRKISTWPFLSMIYPECKRDQEHHNLNITIEDDVWIGYGTIILAGVTIGKGSVIGAGAVVAKDIPPYSVFVGNRVVKKRFSDQVIEKLMDIDYSRIQHHSSDEYRNYVNTLVDELNVDLIKEAFCKER